MQKNNVKILSTRLIDDSLIAEALSCDIDIDQIPFIKTETTIDSSVEKRINEICQESHFVVFTSLNAVRAIQKLNTKPAHWKIFCISPETKKLVEEVFGVQTVVGFADDGRRLVEKIVENSLVKKIVFFCGNQRRDEIPAKLKTHEIDLEEIVVYKTIETPDTISKEYDGILFFSPSAVKSFFSVNILSNKPELFAIGNTTKEELKRFSDLPVSIPDSPSAEKMINQVIKHFSKTKLNKCNS